MTNECRVCGNACERTIADSPYWECGGCGLWQQFPLPDKVYQTPDEYDLAAMPERDVQINLALAQSLFATLPTHKPDADGNLVAYRPRTLDIGCKHPVMANELGRLGCDAWALDGVEPEKMKHVRTRAADFEKIGVSPLGNDVMRGLDLITLIHVFEHFYDPVRAMGKLRLMLNDDGRVFIRIPDNRVEGYQQHLSEHHYKIHPYFHSLQSILEICAERGNAFSVESYRPMPGAGQSDIVLRPITKRPQIACCAIVRNEERDLPRALKSIESFADHVAIIDTGSTDDTVRVATGTIPNATTCSVYLGASERDEDGTFKLWDFAKARNHSLEVAEAFGDAWVFWFDADDEIITPRAIRRLVYWDEFDAHQIWMIDGQQVWTHIRLWRASKRVRFAGRVHEYAVVDHCRLHMLTNSQVNGSTVKPGDPMIRHHGEPVATQENSNPRNLRILERMWAEEPTPRTAFYIADTHRTAGTEANRSQAILWYEKRIGMVGGYEDERGFAMLYRARLLRMDGRHDEADAQSNAGIEQFPGWMEFFMELADGAYRRQDYERCIGLCQTAHGKPIPPTQLWREPQMYTDQPLRLISWCYEHIGDIPQAIFSGHRAALAIGKSDEEWALRMRRLEAMQAAATAQPEAPAINRNARAQIALHRPGAIGDVLMTLNLVPLLREMYEDECDVHYFCSAGIGAMSALGPTILAAGCDAVLDCAGLSAWAKRYDRVVNLVGYPIAEGHPQDRPGKFVMRKHLIEYFADEMDVSLSGGIGEPSLPALTLEKPQELPRVGSGYATLQVRAGWSTMKQWPLERWAIVQHALRDRGIRTMILEPFVTPTLSEAVALVANARIHLGIDSFAQHLTQYYWTDGPRARRVPGVILWGSTQPDALGYSHNVNIVDQPECGPCWRETAEWSRMAKEPCIDIAPNGVHRCMDNIKPEAVIEAALRLWEEAQ